MTPSLPSIMMGQVVALSTPMPPEASGDYLVGRLGLLAMLSILAAQEAERGVDTRVWENQAMRAILDRAGAPAVRAAAPDLTWTALDQENADLRRALIAVHIAVEERGDAAMDLEIRQFYREMAERRRLDLPSAG